MSWPSSVPITFTRATAANRWNGAGLLVSAAVDAPRFDFDPASKAPRGLLIEAAFTNLMLRSEEFDNAAWTKSNGGITANAIAAPDGTTSMDLFTVTSTSAGGANAYQNVTTTASVRQAASFFLKKFDTDWACITASDGSGNGRRWWFNLNTGVIGTSTGAGSAFTNVGSRIEHCGGGIYRCFVAWLQNAGTTMSLEVYPVVDADGSIGVTAGRRGYVWGAMAGVGEDCGSYVKTTTASVARAADIASIATAKLLRPTGFGFWAKFMVPQVWQTAHRHAGVLHDGTTNNLIRLGWSGGTTSLTDDISAGGVSVYQDAAPVALAAFAPMTHVGRVAPNDFRGCWNGTLNGADTAGAMPSGITTARLGARTATPTEPLNGWLQGFGLMPRPPTDAQMQAFAA